MILDQLFRKEAADAHGWKLPALLTAQRSTPTSPEYDSSGRLYPRDTVIIAVSGREGLIVLRDYHDDLHQYLDFVHESEENAQARKRLQAGGTK